MNVQQLVSQEAASKALLEYKAHRDVYDARDWEMERIYRAIAKGKLVISAVQAIIAAGLDDQNRPRLAICEAHAKYCVFERERSEEACFGIGQGPHSWWSKSGRIRIPWPGLPYSRGGIALLPRIPPQHRPKSSRLSNYHLLWEADWKEIPRDPMLLKRIGKDAWVVLAQWDLTEVELSVLRAHAQRLT